MDIEITFISDPGCPWGYSASPSLAALEWRYGERLTWRLVTIGLAEDASTYEARGYDPIMMGQRMEMFRQFGMPFTVGPRARLTGTGRACRAIHAVRLLSPGDEITAFRALQFGWFTTRMLMDEDPNIATALDTARVHRQPQSVCARLRDHTAKFVRRLRLFVVPAIDLGQQPGKARGCRAAACGQHPLPRYGGGRQFQPKKTLFRQPQRHTAGPLAAQHRIGPTIVPRG